MSDKASEFMLGDLTRGITSIGQQVQEIRTDMKDSQEKADVSRATVHRRLDENSDKHSLLEATVATMGKDVSDMKSVTDGVQKMTYQAEGAGTLGHALLRVGGWVLATAGWFVGVYTYWTGRPPP